MDMATQAPLHDEPRPAPHWARCLVLTLAVGAAGAQAAPAAAPTHAPTLHVSRDGALVVDTRSRIAWARCVEGMHWNGKTCAGEPLLFNFREAQSWARERWQRDGVRWRLPRVPELRRLVDRNARPPAVDARLFPNAPPEWHWTSTASVNAVAVNPYAYGNAARGGQGESTLKPQHAWAVDMSSGQGQGDVGRATRLPIRLVRPAPEAQDAR